MKCLQEPHLLPMAYDSLVPINKAEYNDAQLLKKYCYAETLLFLFYLFIYF